MTETSGALSTAIQQSGHTPSIFEVIAEDNLHNSTRPAFRHILKVSRNNCTLCKISTLLHSIIIYASVCLLIKVNLIV